MREEVVAEFRKRQRSLEIVEQDIAGAVAEVAEAVIAAYRQGSKVLVMGNGGSAADAQHFAAELVGRFAFNRPALAAVALTTDTSILTAVGNDYGFDEVFSRQIEALAQEGDLVVGISTSGNSPNVIRGLEAASERGCRTVAFLGRDGGAIRTLADIPVVVSSSETPLIQEAHIASIHIICRLVEEALFGARR